MNVWPIKILLSVGASLSLALVGVTAIAEDAAADAMWPQWRGPTRDGRVIARAWPESLQGDAVKLDWRIENLGPSYSGPIVARDRVFSTETRDKSIEVAKAYDRATGKELWKTEWPGAMDVPFFARSNGSWIRSTPAYDSELLFVAGIRDVLVCLDAATGKELWRFDFVERLKTPLPSFGFVCSPLVDGDAVYVQAGASVVKLNKRNGEMIWRSMDDGGGMMGSAFGSPVLAQAAGSRQLFVQARLQMAGLDPASGKVLWSAPIPADRGMNIFTPVVFGDAFFVSSYGGGSRRFDLVRKDESLSATQSWEFKAQGYMSTPIVIDGYAYMHLRNQRFTCIDLKSGRDKWTTSQIFGKYWSLVANGDRVLALDEKGILYLIRATPEKFDLIDSRKMSSAECWAHLAVCGDELYVRELNALAKYRWR